MKTHSWEAGKHQDAPQRMSLESHSQQHHSTTWTQATTAGKLARVGTKQQLLLLKMKNGAEILEDSLSGNNCPTKSYNPRTLASTP